MMPTTCKVCGEVHAATLPNGHPRCQKHRKRKRGGGQCGRQAAKGKPACFVHGGSPRVRRGPLHYRWKNGDHSKYAGLLVGQALEGYVETLQDTDLRTVREQIALAAGLEKELVGRLARDEGESGSAWRAVRRLVLAIREAHAVRDAVALAAALTDLYRVALEGAMADTARRELQDVLDLARKLRDTESRKVEREQRALTAEQVVDLARVLVGVALEHIRDPGDRARFADRIYHLEQSRGLLPTSAPTPN